MSEQHSANNNTPVQIEPKFRVVPAAQGIVWLKQALALVRQNPMGWVRCSLIMMLSFFLSLIAIMLIPLLFPLYFVLTSLFIGGLMLGCFQLTQGKSLTSQALFSGFKHNTKPLALVGLVYFSGTLLSALLAFWRSDVMGHGLYLPAGLEDILKQPVPQISPDEALKTLQSLVLPILLMMGLMIPVLMAFWFAPALVMLFNQSPITALKLSLRACALNTWPFLIYGLVALFALFIGMLVIGVLSIMLPFIGPILKFSFQIFIAAMAMASIYTAFKDIFPVVELFESQDEDSPSDHLIA